MKTPLSHWETARWQSMGPRALFAWNHSGGKDSQAGLIRLLEVIPREQLLVVHAALGDVEWEGALELAQGQAEAAGVPFVVARARRTLLEMVNDRFATRPGVPSWPSSGQRQCTSDCKRGPIEREVRRYAKAHGFTVVVNAMGMRAEESRDRAKKETWKRNKKNSKAGRDWYDWLPIHAMLEAEVFETIAAAGQKPHPAYLAGNKRLSCLFCILGNKGDAHNAAVHRPEMFREYVETERRTGYTVHQGQGLEAFAGITVDEAFKQRRTLRVVA